MLSYPVYVTIVFGSILGMIIIGFLVLVLAPVTRLADWLEKMFDFQHEVKESNDTIILHVYDDQFELTKKFRSRVPFILALGTCVLLSILVFFEGCVFSTRHFYSDKECSERTPNCYLFKSDFTNFKPLYNFTCELELPVIPKNMSASYAICYGYVLPNQSSMDILNQLGVCQGLLYLALSVYPWLYKHGRSILGRVTLGILLVGLIIFEIVILSMQLNISFMTIVLLTLSEILIVNIFILQATKIKSPSEPGEAMPLLENQRTKRS